MNIKSIILLGSGHTTYTVGQPRWKGEPESGIVIRITRRGDGSFTVYFSDGDSIIYGAHKIIAYEPDVLWAEEVTASAFALCFMVFVCAAMHQGQLAALLKMCAAFVGAIAGVLWLLLQWGGRYDDQSW